MPTQDSYATLSEFDSTTYITGFYTDDGGKLVTVKVPASFVYGDKWTTGAGAPGADGVGAGDMYLNTLTGEVSVWDGTQWGSPVATLISGIYDIPIWIEGKPLASEVAYLLTAARAFTLPQNLPDSVATAETAATASTVISIQKKAVSDGSFSEIGTITFAGAGTTGTLVLSAAVSFAAGDKLAVVFPASADATLADIAITLCGTRP